MKCNGIGQSLYVHNIKRRTCVCVAVVCYLMCHTYKKNGTIGLNDCQASASLMFLCVMVINILTSHYSSFIKVYILLHFQKFKSIL